MSSSAMSLDTLSDDYTHLVDVLCAISEKYFYAGHLIASVYVIEQGEQLVNEGLKVNRAEFSRLLIQRGKILTWSSILGDNQLEKAECSLKYARQIADEMDDESLQAYAKLHLGHTLDFQKLYLDKKENYRYQRRA